MPIAVLKSDVLFCQNAPPEAFLAEKCGAEKRGLGKVCECDLRFPQISETKFSVFGMFYLKYLFANVRLALRLLLRGEWQRVVLAVYARLYVLFYRIVFPIVRPFVRNPKGVIDSPGVSVETDHPVAITSPDYAVPHGTRYNNSTNRKFVLLMHEHFRSVFPDCTLAFMDLGCSGGQLVADFASLGWVAVGLEGSDYSLKHRRANWRDLANRNLFTCDISKPFRVKREGRDLQFHLITAWEVLEHISMRDLETVFKNITEHLLPGGCFVASTSSSTSIVNGVELHQTRMPNAEWRSWIEQRFPELEPVDLHLRIYQHVRFDFGEPSFLAYRKKGGTDSGTPR